MRKLLIAGNWKMFKTTAETQTFFTAFLPLVKDIHHREIVVCPPFVDLATSLDAVKGSVVVIGAQNMHFAEEGAYTGEISPGMLLSLGATHVILGHSERRQYFGETDEDVNRKLIAALKHHMVPIVCIGEHSQQRESGRTEEVICAQVGHALRGIDPTKLHRM